MPTYTAEQLDLTRLPGLQLVTVDVRAEEAALKASIVARFQARGVPYDVERLETDTAMILAEEFAFRKGAALAQLNDAGKRVTLTYGYGAALDQLAATYFSDIGLRRLTLTPANPDTGAPAVMEPDDRFKLRLSLAGEARTYGTLGGYEYMALTVAPWLDDALALNHASGLCAPGEIVLVVLGRDPDPDPQTAIPAQEEPAQLALVQAALLDRNTALGTDSVSARGAVRVPVTRGYTLGIRRGPDPALVTSAARVAYAAYTARQRPVGDLGARERLIGKMLAESGEKAALKVGGVEYVHAQPGSGQDVLPGPDGIVRVTSLAVDWEYVSD